MDSILEFYKGDISKLPSKEDLDDNAVYYAISENETKTVISFGKTEVATKAYLDATIGNINIILESILGE